MVTRKSFKYYMSGLSGCGKSWLLYQLVCRLMSRDDFVVVYAQSIDYNLIDYVFRSLYFECKSDPALCVSLAHHLDQLKSLIEKDEFISLTERDVIDASLIIEQITTKLRAENRTLIFIFDQFSPNRNIIDFIHGLFLTNIVIISDSASDATEFFPGARPQMVRLLFNEEELKTFIVLNIPIQQTHNLANWCRDETVSHILGITGAVGLELYRFVTGESQNGIHDILPTTALCYRFKQYSELFYRDHDLKRLLRWFDKMNRDPVVLDNIERLDFMKKRIKSKNTMQ